jgi:hypothetical protein
VIASEILGRRKKIAPRKPSARIVRIMMGRLSVLGSEAGVSSAKLGRHNFRLLYLVQIDRI